MRKGKSNGYPSDYLRSRHRFIVGFLLFLFFFATVTIFLTYNAIYSNAPMEFATVASGAFLFVLWVFYASLKSPIYIAIYFEEKVAGKAIWSIVLARNCIYLDDLCAKSNAAIFSSFGFTDDWSGKKMIWHPPEKGLQMVAILLNQLNANPGILEESTLIIADLQKVSERLQEAKTNGVHFCFILHGDGSNLMEIEQRCGYF